MTIWLLPAACGQTARWTDFRGPTRDGRAPPGAAPLKWSEEENVRWKVPVEGVGWSSPVVWDRQIWLTTAGPKGREMMAMAFDTETGKVIHRRVLVKVDKPAPKHAQNSYASPTPAIQAGRAYVHFGSYGTFCLDTKSGQTIWERRDLECDHVTGPGSSPILHDGLLVFHMDGADVQYVVALDAKTGETRWKTDRSLDLSKLPRDTRRSFSTPIVMTVDDQPTLISTGAQGTFAYDPASGKELWRIRHKGFSNVSRPIAAGDVVYLNTGFARPQLLAIRPGPAGDITGTDTQLWAYARSVPTIPSPLHLDGRLYLVSEGGVASCLDAGAGTLVWKQRLRGEHSASLLHANGRIYAFDREGRTVVFAPGDTYQELAVNELEGGFMASPAVAHGALFLRTRTHLYRVQEN